MWSVYADSFANSDFVGVPRLSQPFTLPKLTKIKAASVWLVIFNSPSFTSLELRIYQDRDNRPTDLLYTFDKTFTLSDLLQTHGYGLKEVRFDFTTPRWLHGLTKYHLVPFVNGSAFTTSSYLALVKAFPDPNTTHDSQVTLTTMPLGPYYTALIGADE